MSLMLHIISAIVAFALIIGYFANVHRKRKRNVGARITPKRKLVLRTILYLCINDFILSMAYAFYIVLEKLITTRSIVLTKFVSKLKLVIAAYIFAANLAAAAWGLCFACILLYTFLKTDIKRGLHPWDIINNIFVGVVLIGMFSLIIIFNVITIEDGNRFRIIFAIIDLTNASTYIVLFIFEMLVVVIMVVYMKMHTGKMENRVAISFILFLCPFLLSGISHIFYTLHSSIVGFSNKCSIPLAYINFTMYYIIIPLRPILNGAAYIYTPFYVRHLITKYCCTCSRSMTSIPTESQFRDEQTERNDLTQPWIGSEADSDEGQQALNPFFASESVLKSSNETPSFI